ncbi:MAG: hypothetical protein VZR53_14110 [Prevotella sp.]|nr:hypothetical protein [Prevotella sp.]
MKYLYILIIFFTIICCCKSKVADSAIANAVQQDDSINAADTLYDFVSKIYKHNFMKTKAYVLDSLYLSSEFFAFCKEDYKSDPDAYPNHWIDDEYAHYPSFKIGKITQLSDTTSTVDIKVHNGDSQSEYQLVMLLENGKWKVDDFVSETSTEKYTCKTQDALEIPLQGHLSQYSLRFCEQTENEHESVINLYKNKKLVSKNIVEVGGNIYLDAIAPTKEGFKIIYCWVHDSRTVFLFKYLNENFYFYKVIRYSSFEIEEGYDYKRTVDVLKTPILFQNVDFEKYIFGPRRIVLGGHMLQSNQRQ